MILGYKYLHFFFKEPPAPTTNPRTPPTPNPPKPNPNPEQHRSLASVFRPWVSVRWRSPDRSDVTRWRHRRANCALPHAFCRQCSWWRKRWRWMAMCDQWWYLMISDNLIAWEETELDFNRFWLVSGSFTVILYELYDFIWFVLRKPRIARAFFVGGSRICQTLSLKEYWATKEMDAVH